MASNYYIIKSETEGIKLLTLNDDLNKEKFTLQNLPDAKVEWSNFTDSLQLQITKDHIVIAATHNERIEGILTSTIQVKKVTISEA